MKHKTEARKGLIRLQISGQAPVGSPILMADGREAGTLFTQSGGMALAHMRFDRMEGLLTAGAATLRRAWSPAIFRRKIAGGTGAEAILR